MRFVAPYVAVMQNNNVVKMRLVLILITGANTKISFNNRYWLFGIQKQQFAQTRKLVSWIRAATKHWIS